MSNLSCLFCSEEGTRMILFFKCEVAREMWKNISPLTGIPVLVELWLVSCLWIYEKKHKILNILHVLCYGWCGNVEIIYDLKYHHGTIGMCYC
jgi:hypothetical protein